MDATKNQTLQRAILELLNLNLSNRLIEIYLGLCPATIHKYLKIFKQEGRRIVTTSSDECRPKMLKLLAQVTRRPSLLPLSDNELIKNNDFVSFLNNYLQTAKIIEILDYSSYHIESLLLFRSDPNLPQGYKDLFTDLAPYQFSPRGQDLWKSYLEKIALGEIDLPSAKELKKGNSVIINQILNDLTSRKRVSTMPDFDDKFCQFIETYLLSKLPFKDEKITRMYYGLNESKKEIPEICKILGIPQNRIQETRRRLRSRYIHLSDKIKQMMISPLIYEISKKKHRIDDLDLSIRLTNILESINVQYLEDLANFKEIDLLKNRGLGHKTMAEIKAVLGHFGLSLR